MRVTPAEMEAYQQEIETYARALAVARLQPVIDRVPSTQSAALVKMFADGNLDKRFLKLKDQVEYFEDVFPDLEEALVEYVRTVPLAAYDTGCHDTECFLDFLAVRQSLSPEQVDHLRCQRSRHALEFLAWQRRVVHVRFQELSASSGRFDTELSAAEQFQLHLNPLHLWTTFETAALIDKDDEVPADVLFYAVGDDLRTAVFEDVGKKLIQVMEQHSPCRLQHQDLVEVLPDPEERREFVTVLAEMGIVAFG